MRLPHPLRHVRHRRHRVGPPALGPGAVRADLAKRTGVDLLDVTDADIRAWFDAANVRVQFVDDYQVRAAGQPGAATPITQYPGSSGASSTRAGTVARGNGMTLDLGVVRDSTLNADERLHRGVDGGVPPDRAVRPRGPRVHDQHLPRRHDRRRGPHQLLPVRTCQVDRLNEHNATNAKGGETDGRTQGIGRIPPRSPTATSGCSPSCRRRTTSPTRTGATASPGRTSAVSAGRPSTTTASGGVGTQAKAATSTVETFGALPFTVYGRVDCSPVGYTQEEHARAPSRP